VIEVINLAQRRQSAKHRAHTSNAIFLFNDQRARHRRQRRSKPARPNRSGFVPRATLPSLSITLKITSDITNKRAESTLNSISACFSSWFVTVHITSDITSEKGERLCWAMMQKVFQHTWINSARKICPSNKPYQSQTSKRRTKSVLHQFRTTHPHCRTPRTEKSYSTSNRGAYTRCARTQITQHKNAAHPHHTQTSNLGTHMRAKIAYLVNGTQ
jgi:hypothetical protein